MGEEKEIKFQRERRKEERERERRRRNKRDKDTRQKSTSKCRIPCFSWSHLWRSQLKSKRRFHRLNMLAQSYAVLQLLQIHLHFDMQLLPLRLSRKECATRESFLGLLKWPTTAASFC